MNENNTLTIQSLELIEEVGLFFEKTGYLPSAARVYALLMIWKDPELHFDEIQKILNLSKGATSKALNALTSIERVEMFTKPGVRKKYYRVKTFPGRDSSKNFLAYLMKMKEHLIKIETFKKANNISGVSFKDEVIFFDNLIDVFNKVLNDH